MTPDLDSGGRSSYLVTHKMTDLELTDILGSLHINPTEHFHVLPPPGRDPARYVGRFFHGSELGQIQISVDGLEGAGSAMWHNDYFNSLDADTQLVFKRYYRTDFGLGSSVQQVILPENTPSSGALQPIPGGGRFRGVSTLLGFPVAADTIFANRVFLSLKEIRYSSRYGGTVQLRFELADLPTAKTDPDTGDWLLHSDDFEFEFGHKELLFDTPDLELSVYVAIDPALFNPSSSFYDEVDDAADGSPSHFGVFAEFKPGEVNAYKRNPLVVVDRVSAVEFGDAEQQALGEILTKVSIGLAETLREEAARFVYGFLHTKFIDEIGSTDKVQAVWISDDFFDLKTRPGIVRFAIYFQIGGLSPWGWDGIGFGEAEIATKANVVYYLENPQAQTVGDLPRVVAKSKRFKLGPFEPSPWVFAGKWMVDECGSGVRGVDFEVHAREDDIVFDDSHVTFTLGYWLSGSMCSALEAAKTAEAWGVVDDEEWKLIGGVRFPGEPLWDWIFRKRVYLQLD